MFSGAELVFLPLSLAAGPAPCPESFVNTPLPSRTEHVVQCSLPMGKYSRVPSVPGCPMTSSWEMRKQHNFTDRQKINQGDDSTHVQLIERILFGVLTGPWNSNEATPRGSSLANLWMAISLIGESQLQRG